MPQLDTIYTFMTYLWTWMVLYLTAQKIMAYQITNNPTIYPTSNKPTTMQLWM